MGKRASELRRLRVCVSLLHDDRLFLSCSFFRVFNSFLNLHLLFQSAWVLPVFSKGCSDLYTYTLTVRIHHVK